MIEFALVSTFGYNKSNKISQKEKLKNTRKQSATLETNKELHNEIFSGFLINFRFEKTKLIIKI